MTLPRILSDAEVDTLQIELDRLQAQAHRSRVFTQGQWVTFTVDATAWDLIRDSLHSLREARAIIRDLRAHMDWTAEDVQDVICRAVRTVRMSLLDGEGHELLFFEEPCTMKAGEPLSVTLTWDGRIVES
jgi:hypothetical protein